jgi:(R,R)-butanediol dehydrogenase/meso-butanediol dehydrogenase/diacetyl reductase
MRAAVYTGARTIAVQEHDAPPPGPGQVQLDVAYTGICGTDLHIFHGDMDVRVGDHAVIGHEMSGRIALLGAEVDVWQIGQPVTVMPLAWCATCPACRAGHEHVCHNLDFLGIDSAGAMQARWNVPASTLIALPSTLPLRQAAMIEPVAVAVHDVRRSQLRAGEQVVVVGGGPVGLLIAAVAASDGAQVLLVEPNSYRRDVAAGLGLHAVDPAVTDVAGAVRQWTGGAGAAVAFEVSGAQAGVDTAVEVLAVRGRLVMVAIHPTPRHVDLHRFFWRELTLIGARLYRREDFERAVDLVAGGQVPVERLISQVVPLADVAEAFAALESGGAMKVLIDLGSAAAAGSTHEQV